MNFGFNFGFSSSISTVLATHIYTGTLLPTGTEVLGGELWDGTPDIINFPWVDNGDGTFSIDGSQSGTIEIRLLDNQFTIGGRYVTSIEVVSLTAGYMLQYLGSAYEYLNSTGTYDRDTIITSNGSWKISANASCIATIRPITAKSINTGLLRDTGKQKQNLTINSGAMTLLNGVDQTISPTFASSNYVCYFKDEVFTENTTSGQTSITFDENSTYSALIALADEPTEAQKQFIKDYQHKAVAHYNVNDAYTTPYLPDVTASLNMPLTEVGAYKIDYSKAFGGELVQDNTLITNLGVNWVGGAGGLLSVVNGALRITVPDPSGGYASGSQVNIPTEVGKTYLVYGVGSGFNTISMGPTSDNYYDYLLNGDISSGLYFTATDVSCSIKLHTNKNTPGDYKDFKGYITLRQATAYEVANYTTSCDLTQQEDGLQLITFKQNNGILEKLQDDRMNLTGEEKPALQLDMTDTELYENGEFSIGFVIKRELISKRNFILHTVSENNGMWIKTPEVGYASAFQVILFDGTNYSVITDYIDANYHHIVFTVSSTEMLITIDGVDRTPVTHNFVPSGLNFKDSVQLSPKGELTDFKIWKKALTAEERAKEWAKAQKTIAKLYPTATASIALDIIEDITSMDAVNITGSTGGDVKNGDIVTVIANGVSYTGTVLNSNFIISVDGADMIADADSTVTASVTTSMGYDSGEVTATTSKAYTVILATQFDYALTENLVSDNGYLYVVNGLGIPHGKLVNSDGSAWTPDTAYPQDGTIDLSGGHKIETGIILSPTEAWQISFVYNVVIGTSYDMAILDYKGDGTADVWYGDNNTEPALTAENTGLTYTPPTTEYVITETPDLPASALPDIYISLQQGVSGVGSANGVADPAGITINHIGDADYLSAVSLVDKDGVAVSETFQLNEAWYYDGNAQYTVSGTNSDCMSDTQLEGAYFLRGSSHPSGTIKLQLNPSSSYTVWISGASDTGSSATTTNITIDGILKTYIADTTPECQSWTFTTSATGVTDILVEVANGTATTDYAIVSGINIKRN